MSEARYWRVVGLQSIAGGPLELSALHLYLAGNRVDATATLTCTIPPSAGAVANLQDDDTTSTCRWLDVSAPGFALEWDFGVGVTQEVGAIRLGAGALHAEWLDSLTLQSSSDGLLWVTLEPITAPPWPGANALQPVPVPGAWDFHSPYVSLLMHCDGADGSTAFTDSSLVPKAITAYGNAKISTAQSKFGGASLLLDGAGDYLTAPANDDYIFGTGNFTVELWIKTTTTTESVLVDQYSGSYSWQLAVKSGKLSWYGGTSAYVLTSLAPVNDGTWHHVAVTREAGVLRFFVGGVASGQVTDTTNYSKSVVLGIGAQVASRNATYDYTGYIDDLRITKGVARYTENFTPPVEPFPSVGGTRQVALRPRISPTVTTLSGGTAQDAKVVVPLLEGAFDMQDGGWGKIVGTVKEKSAGADQPLRRKVILLNYRDHRMIRETWSDAVTGKYEFLRIDPNRAYTVITYDYNLNYRAVIADNLMPELM